MTVRKLWLSFPGAKRLESNKRCDQERPFRKSDMIIHIKISKGIMLIGKKKVTGVRLFISLKLPD